LHVFQFVVQFQTVERLEFEAYARPARTTRNLRAPLQHGFDARVFTRALSAEGQNHVGPANSLSCDSRPPASPHQTRPGPCCRGDFSLAQRDARAPAQRAGLPRRGRSRETWTGVMLEGCQRQHRSEQPDGALIPASVYCISKQKLPVVSKIPHANRAISSAVTSA